MQCARNLFWFKKKIRNSQKFVHGADTYLMFIDPFNVGNIQRVELFWKYDGSVLDPGTVCGLFCNDHIYVRSVEISELNNYPESYVLFIIIIF